MFQSNRFIQFSFSLKIFLQFGPIHKFAGWIRCRFCVHCYAACALLLLGTNLNITSINHFINMLIFLSNLHHCKRLVISRSRWEYGAVLKKLLSSGWLHKDFIVVSTLLVHLLSTVSCRRFLSMFFKNARHQLLRYNFIVLTKVNETGYLVIFFTLWGLFCSNNVL